MFWTAVIRPNAVPTRSFSTMSGTEGHIAAGTSTNAAPSTIIAIAGGQAVYPSARCAGIISSDPTIMSEARRPKRSTSCPAKGAKNIEAVMTIDVVPCAVPNMCVRL